MTTLSIRDAFRDKVILFAGGSGFLGKVWLSHALDQLPDIRRIYVLLRSNRRQTAQERFEAIVNSSFVFQNLHETWGPQLSTYLSDKVRVIDGDMTKKSLGLSATMLNQLKSDLDLLINCAGLVDFNPDVRDALANNVESALNAAQVVAQCDHAALLHVSTCFVAGKQNGDIAESINITTSPLGKPYDPSEEYFSLRNRIWALEQATDPASLKHKRIVRKAMIREGQHRAHKRGWTNTYTYTKAMAEGLLKIHYPHIPFAIIRPSIVESAMAFPFPGWNEGFNTCGPLANLLSSWFRYLPAKPGNPFDIIPVDLVSRSFFVAGAHLLTRQQVEVYQAATSHRNCLTIDYAADLTAQAHRLYYARHGQSWIARHIRSRWHVRCVGESVPWLSRRFLKAMCLTLEGVFNHKVWRHALGRLAMAKLWREKITRLHRKLEQLESILDLFKPFIHDHHQVFITNNLMRLPVAEAEFAFKPELICWRSYWLDVHVPGLRRWCFPHYQRQEIIAFEPRDLVTLQTPCQPKVATRAVTEVRG